MGRAVEHLARRSPRRKAAGQSKKIIGLPMNNNNKTLRQWALTSGESQDKAIRHRARLGVGTRYGISWVLTEEEWERVLASMRTARRGNPNWIKSGEVSK